MNKICDLSKTLPPAQRNMVADNVFSIAEAYFSTSAWMRAIYADDTPIGFISTGDLYGDEIELVLHLDGYPITVPGMIDSGPA